MQQRIRLERMAYLTFTVVSFLTVGCLVMGAAGFAAVLQLTPRLIGISHPQSHSSTILQLSVCCKPNTESCTVAPFCPYGPKCLNERVGEIAQ